MSEAAKISDVIDVMQTLENCSIELKPSYADECDIVKKIAEDVWDCATAVRADLEDLAEGEVV